MCYPFVRNLALCATIAIAAGLSASCAPQPAEPAPEPLPIGEEVSGTLKGGESKTFALSVQADTYYAVSLVGSAGNVGFPDLNAQISGSTSPAEVVLSVRGPSLLRPEAVKGFRAEQDGVLEIQLENRTEGLTIQPGQLVALLGDPSEARYRLRALELGRDDYGDSPAQATRLVDDGQPLIGTVLFGDEYDYFICPVVEGRQYDVTFEASGPAKIATSSVDRFDEFNFGVVAPGNRDFILNASAGKPGSLRVTAFQTHDVLVGVAAGPENQLAGILGIAPGLSSFPLNYAITITSAAGGWLTSGQEVHDVIANGNSLDYFIDIPVGAKRIVTELTGAPRLIVYVNPNEPGTFPRFQTLVSPILEGTTASVRTTPEAGATRYFFTVDTVDKLAANFTLRVTIELDTE